MSGKDAGRQHERSTAPSENGPDHHDASDHQRRPGFFARSASAHEETTPTRVLSAYAVIVVILTALVVSWPSASHRLGQRINNARTSSLDSRLIYGAYGPGISPMFLLAAKRLVTADSSYAVVTGPNAATPTDVTLPWVFTFTRFLLFPARQVPLGEAQWLLCYGCDQRGLSVRSVPAYEESDGGITIGMIRR
jgi:hypothetical protein